MIKINALLVFTLICSTILVRRRLILGCGLVVVSICNTNAAGMALLLHTSTVHTRIRIDETVHTFIFHFVVLYLSVLYPISGGLVYLHIYDKQEKISLINENKKWTHKTKQENVYK